MKDDEKLIENEDDVTRDSNVKMGRISDVTLEKIENLKETQSQEGKKKKIPSIQTVFSILLKSNIEDILFGIYLRISQIYKTGDRILLLEKNIEGYIKSFGLRLIEIKTFLKINIQKTLI